MSTSALAHLGEDLREHLLFDHLQGVAELAGRFAAAFDSADMGALAGLWHDLGKYAADFQEMIRAANGVDAHIDDSAAQDVIPGRGKVDHSSAGAVLACRADRGAAGVALAFAIAGHHAGLADFSDLKTRLVNKESRLDDARRGKPTIGGAPPELTDRKVPPLPPWLQPRSAEPQRERRRQEFWIRFLFSALCDADFLDTERFYDAGREAQRQGAPSLEDLETALDARLDRLMAGADPQNEVQRVRAEVRADAVAAGALPPGFFSMTVPTGGGKTLASMAFALRHARRHGLRRVVVAIPYTSIIEQSAQVFRDTFAALGPLAVIEHHSALDPQREDHRNRLASENWDAPVVVTTTVQLFESLFANRTSRCRKLHNLARSVIVLDEAQTLPTRLMPTILDGLQTLVEQYGASVVFCTATQPALARTPIFPCGITGTREIVASERRAFERLRRVAVRWPLSKEPTRWPELAAELAAESDVLAIVHLRRDARTFCETLDQQLGHQETLHLSALMCPEHRSRVLAGALARKRAKEPLRLVTTQLVEAGVDVDFPVVYRALGGLDAMAQAAGRCNREGRLAGTLGQLRIFVAETEPPRGILRQALGVTRDMLAWQPELDLFSPDIQRSFFERLYRNVGAERDSIGIQEARAKLNFKETAALFQMIESDWAAPVVVPYGRASELLTELERLGPSRARLRALQRYTVTVPRFLLGHWKRSGRVRTFADTVDAIDDALTSVYDERFGLNIDGVGDAVLDSASLLIE